MSSPGPVMPAAEANASSETTATSTNDVSILQAPLVSYVVYFGTARSSARAWSIWSNEYVTISAVVIVSPFRASDS
jgi:hypothetical protein